MTDVLQRTAAKRFAADWRERGDEKQETQAFWLALLQKVYGVVEPEKYIQFELPVKLDHTSFIDGYIEATHTLIEQKGRDIGLKIGLKQSDGSVLTPYQQARRYAGSLPHDQNPRWIVVCNFQTFEIHDMNRPNDEPEIVALANFEKEYHRLQFLVDTGDVHIKKEMEVSLKAGELVGVLYDALLKQYQDPTDPVTLRSLNALCVRLVFCLYAEDAGIFGSAAMFHNYLKQYSAKDARKALIDLFKVLDTKPENRDPYMDEDLAAFPYVNGGLFADENVIIPRLDETIVNLILHRASEDFDWSAISPTIFGAVFESTLNPDTRRKGGMHYTSIENIHKVIDPLFLDELRAELTTIQQVAVEATRKRQLKAFQAKLARLTFLDPACGSGNFLTETYICLRKLENEVLRSMSAQITLGDFTNPVQVSIGQFYGIEINDFAVTVAKTALWIAESQMLKETEDIVHQSLDFLPLKSYANIVEENALQLDWETVVPKEKLNYIMGNPPFVGYTYQNAQQKVDLQVAMKGIGKNIDYVSGWYFKAARLIQETDIRTAFVSTNSITQGEQVAAVWGPLFNQFNIHIDFAHRTFRWDSEASLKAHVHCVIVGFSVTENRWKRLLYTAERVQESKNINAYLLDAPSIFVMKRSKPICNVPEMCKGSQPTDGGNLILSPEEKAEMLSKAPEAEPYIKAFVGAEEFINSRERYCLWLEGASPAFVKRCQPICDRVKNVREMRLNSTKAATRQWADKPTLFTENRHPQQTYIIVPSVSSEQRKYVPMGFLTPDTVASNLVLIVPNATLYHFGLLTSNVHMSWMRAVCGRLEMRYRYSNTLVYNNFPWPMSTDEQKVKIEQTAQAILDARALYPDCSLADLYDETTMPPELRKAHQANDKAVMQAYGFWGKLNSESACVAELMKMYQQLAERK
jgi:hypothetical protein